MKITPFAIGEITKHIISSTGRELIDLFNSYGFKDIYDELGLPDIGKINGQRPSKTEYAKNRIAQLSGKYELRELLNGIINNRPAIVTAMDKLLRSEGYEIKHENGQYKIQGGVINKGNPVVNEAHFQDIQSRILKTLDTAQVSIKVVMAWFTNETLFQKLVDKHNDGLEVVLAIYDDGINRKHGVEISKIPHKMIQKGQRGGLMHNKFCVVDNQVVITGSYNWSDNAEFKNDENITIEHDPAQATKYSVEFRRLTK